VAQQGDAGAVPGEIGHERPQRARALPSVAGRQDARAEGGGGAVAKPGDDREAGARIEPVRLRGQGRGRARGRGRTPGIERRQGRVGAGHENRHPRRGGEVADDLDRLTRAAWVEAEEVTTAQGVQRTGDGRVSGSLGGVCCLCDRGGVGGVACR
jgi:hypothetical protein